MTTKIYSRQISKFALLLFISIFSQNFYSQTAPENTRFFQLNTVKGSRLYIVESTDNFVYHIGTINSSEVGFDNLTAANVGLDDLFVLKSAASTGSNTWFKTFNAGTDGKIIPRNVFADANENVYVFAQFQGSVKVGSKTITSANPTDTFLMKIDSNGNAVWVDYLENGYNSLYKTKCVTEGANTYFVYGGNHLLKLTDADGTEIFNKIYNGVELKSVAVKDQDLYLAGATIISGVNFGSEFINDSNVGFVLKGDKDANFTASLKTVPTQSFLNTSDISDIAFSSNGSLLLTGFYTGSLITLNSESGNFSFTYNPNANYNITARLYNFVANVDYNLGAVSFFRSSSPISQEVIYNIRTDLNSSKLIPYGNFGDFRQINYITDRYKNIVNYINPNGTSTDLSPSSSTTNYSTLLSYNNLGGFTSGSQLVKYGFKMSASGNSYTTTENNNIRVFTTSQYNAENAALAWTKQKVNSIGGSFSKQFQKHLKSAKSDIFFTALAEGKGKFFSNEFNNGQNVFSRYVTRLGADGTAKWTANFSNAANVDELNVSQDFACTDKDDNFYFVAGIKGNSSVFSDAAGNSSNFSTASGNSKVLLKLDQNGKFLWSKQINQSGLSKVAVASDSAGNVYLMGQTEGSLTLDNFSIPSEGGLSLFVVKLSSAGNLIYSKYYKNVGFGFYAFNPVFDSQDNLYVFTEPASISAGTGDYQDYVFGSVTVPANINGVDHLMLKFDNTGNVIFGKNFYANAPSATFSYAWPNNAAFDGTDFIVSGNYYGDSNAARYLGLDLVNVPKVYSSVNSYVPFFAKVNTSGNVIWQKALESNNSNAGNYTNFGLDENKNIYMYYSVKDKVRIGGTEYSFNSTDGNKILLKLDTNGNLVYYKTTDKGMLAYSLVDVIENDKINASGFTSENNFLNYKINNQNATNLYVATFGALDQKYLTPMNNYLILTNAAISNNPGNANSFVFDLVNNVNWTATSDQNWLNLTASQNKNIANVISGNGDAKLTLTAETNNSGSTRSSNIFISGDGGVASKTIVVTQTGILANQEAKTFVTVIYPNPTSDIINIQTDQKISKIEIFDTSGKLLKLNSGSEKSIQVSELVKGIYLIKIYSDNHIINSKFIKN
ncbi:T9SS type A sorting domain-containing protein [Epilithonimonas sp. JDS]|uniref:T9SS type A sorting domain-containing protein n=1 Tax=Epilithonimonas sp. JDS TaxID=2902797 RepID=UPI001E35C6C3|nr:T9SS type A sorting domain-containing protein [Epilithonimonas sp. JDS]MCD9853542.1 T9SS type A sorting domain-containing protein [Epilithonimonas sp. JDS]